MNSCKEWNSTISCKTLTAQVVGSFIYYICKECGQKYKVIQWDGKVEVKGTS